MSFCRTIKEHSETTIDDLATAYTAAIVDGYPSCSAETFTDDIMDGHTGGKLTAIVDIAGFPERGIRAADIMVV